jgi:hypothetical protein
MNKQNPLAPGEIICTVGIDQTAPLRGFSVQRAAFCRGVNPMNAKVLEGGNGRT